MTVEFIIDTALKIMVAGLLLERYRLRKSIRFYKRYVSEKTVEMIQMQHQVEEIKQMLEDDSQEPS